MSPEGVEIHPQLAERSLRGTVVDVHIPNRGQIDVGTLELADCGPQDLASLAGGSVLGELDDGVAHVSKLGRAV